MTRASVLMLDSAYTAGNENSAAIIYYSALDTLPGIGGTFHLPDGCDLNGWGTDYYVYILAENVGGAMETDYASIPVLLNAPER